MLKLDDENGIAWGITFLIGDGRLQPRDKLYLMLEAAKMYYQDQKTKDVKTPNLEGRISTKKEFQILCDLGGIRFDAELDTNKYGKMNLSFLVCDLTKAEQYKNN